MFIAMNRFQVKPGQEEAFESVWKSRDSYLEDVPGFIEFQLLRGPATEECTLFATHTVWESRDAFVAWTKSEAFRKAHAGAGNNKPLYIDSPRLELFDAVQSVSAA